VVSDGLKAFRTWRLLALAALRAESHHRANFVLGILGGIALQCAGLAFIGTILSRFGALGGWSLPELMLLYGMRLTAHGLWTVPFSQLLSIDYAVREAEFDRYLTRPANPLIQLMTRRMPLTPVGDILGGLAVLATALALNDIRWTPLLVLYLVLAIVGGALVELSFQLATSAIAFRLLSTASVKITIDNVFNTFGNYPIKIFGPVARWGLTVVFPLAFAAYLPTSILLGRGGELWVPPWIAWGAPVVGAALFALAYTTWRSQLDHYSSSGN
jgi:ABC-2 type transport system permease protein